MFHDLHRTYLDPAVHETVSTIIRQHSTHQTDVRKAMLEPLHFDDGEEILDLGCGFGFLAAELARLCPEHTGLTGVDACGTNRETYLHRVRSHGCRARFIETLLHDELPFENASFDKVMSSYSLYFFPGILPEIVRVIKPGGLFWALTHSETSFAGIFRATGIDPVGTSLVSLLKHFSTENGLDLLKPHFEHVEVSLYRNALIFYREDSVDFLNYLRFKLPLIDGRFPAAAPLPGELVEKCMAYLERYGRIVIEKDDSAFVCRRPR